MLSTVVELFGFACIVAGVALLSIPAALVTAGAIIVVVSYLGGSE